MKKFSNKYLEAILKKKKGRLIRFNKKDYDPLNELFEQEKLIEEIYKKIKSGKLLQQARRNSLVAMVSCLEVVLKDSFLSILLERENLENFEVCNEKKFSILQIDYILKKDIKFEDLIIESFNFQNLKEINKSFSSVLGCNFFSELKQYKFVLNTKYPENFESLGDFYPDLDKIISLRHEIIHDINPSLKIFKRDLEEYNFFILRFITIMGFFIDDFLENLRKQKNLNKIKKRIKK